MILLILTDSDDPDDHDDPDLRDDPEPLLADQLCGTERPGVKEREHVLGHVVKTLGILQYFSHS